MEGGSTSLTRIGVAQAFIRQSRLTRPNVLAPEGTVQKTLIANNMTLPP
jgi:hypothetical protein